MSDIHHEQYMRRAIALVANVRDLPFGAVIAYHKSGEILAEGWNKSSINPTWHGEIDAMNQLTMSHAARDGSKLVLYTTAEPFAGHPIQQPSLQTIWHDMKSLQAWAKKMKKWM